MEQKKPPGFAFFLLVAFLLLALVFFLGCTENSSAGTNAPITVTVHSAYKTDALNGVTARSGTDFIVVNITLENHGNDPYTFNEKAVILNGAPPIEEKAYTRITSHRYWGRIPAGEKRTGLVIFGTKNSTQDCTLTFFYNKGQDSFTRELGTVPWGPGSYSSGTALSPGPSGTPVRTGDTSPAIVDAGDTASDDPVSLKINSVQKVSRIKGRGTTGNGTMAMPGHVLVVVNVTIRNNELHDGFELTGKSVTLKNLKDGYYAGNSLNELQEIQDELDNPVIAPVTIAGKEAKTGQVVFGITDSDNYRLNLVGSNKTTLAKKNIRFSGTVGKVTGGNGPGNGTAGAGSSSSTKTA